MIDYLLTPWLKFPFLNINTFQFSPTPFLQNSSSQVTQIHQHSCIQEQAGTVIQIATKARFMQAISPSIPLIRFFLVDVSRIDLFTRYYFAWLFFSLNIVHRNLESQIQELVQLLEQIFNIFTHIQCFSGFSLVPPQIAKFSRAT